MVKGCSTQACQKAELDLGLTEQGLFEAGCTDMKRVGPPERLEKLKELM